MAEIRARGVIQFVAREDLSDATHGARERTAREPRDLMKERRERPRNTMIKEERCGTLARDGGGRGLRRERREGRVRARRVDVGRTRTRRTRDRDSEEERDAKRGAKEGGEERSKGLRRKEKGTRKEGGERDEAKQRRIEAGCCAVTVH